MRAYVLHGIDDLRLEEKAVPEVGSGSWNSSFTHEDTDDWHYVLQRLEGKRVEPERLITRLLSFGELQQGLEIMRDKREEYVKIMVKK